MEVKKPTTVAELVVKAGKARWEGVSVKDRVAHGNKYGILGGRPRKRLKVQSDTPDDIKVEINKK